jgi:hypothetical protein
MAGFAADKSAFECVAKCAQAGVDKLVAKTKRESRLLDKDLKAADNSASVLITAQNAAGNGLCREVL